MTVGGKRVGDARERWFNKAVVHRIEKSLFIMVSLDLGESKRLLLQFERTGPVKTFPDLVDHVPTS